LIDEMNKSHDLFIKHYKKLMTDFYNSIWVKNINARSNN
jgi:hypothetical protein